MKAFLLVAVMVLSELGGEAFAAAWRMVDGEGELAFTVFYEGQEAPGVFHRFDVMATLDEGAVEYLRVEVDLRSVDMFSADINEQIVLPEWLDAEQSAMAVFESERIEATGDTGYLAIGGLDLKDGDRRIEVPFTWRRQGGEAILEGSTTVPRTAFGIGMGEWESGPISVDVIVNYSVTMQLVE